MVVTAHPLGTEAGIEILRAGGNAVDAAIAVQFALAVVYPRAGNIGGGGFMIYRGADGEVSSLDFRETAPGASFKDMYLDEEGNVVEGLSRNGHLAVGVPGVVDGMVRAHRRYGKIKDFGMLLDPAIRMAEEGIQLTHDEAKSYTKYCPEFKEHNTQSNPFTASSSFMAGDLFKQPELAEVLKRIKENGRAGFYEGKTAELIVAEMERSNGIITKGDLLSYESVWRQPVIEPYKQYEVISMPPPSSGGIALNQLLNQVETQKGWTEQGFQSKEHVHLFTEAERRVYADRATHLGDPDFWDVPQDSLMSAEYAEARMHDFDPGKATPSDSISAGTLPLPDESEETTHFSIVDTEGNAVSITTTINSNYGSKVVVGGAGFFLNNEMDDFSAKPGVPNQFGLIGNDANAIQPGKRMLSSMTPTIITKEGKLFMVLGTPGGSTIITSVFQTFVNVAEFGMPLKEAVHAKRFHSQWLPDQIYVEDGAISPGVRTELEGMGHKLHERSYIGKVEAILIHPDGKREGVADNRGEDHAAGF